MGAAHNVLARDKPLSFFMGVLNQRLRLAVTVSDYGLSSLTSLVNDLVFLLQDFAGILNGQR